MKFVVSFNIVCKEIIEEDFTYKIYIDCRGNGHRKYII